MTGFDYLVIGIVGLSLLFGLWRGVVGEIIALVEFEEFSYAETAAIVGCPVGTVRSRLHRAKQALQQRLLELFPAEPRNTV